MPTSARLPSRQRTRTHAHHTRAHTCTPHAHAPYTHNVHTLTNIHTHTHAHALHMRTQHADKQSIRSHAQHADMQSITSPARACVCARTCVFICVCARARSCVRACVRSCVRTPESRSLCVRVRACVLKTGQVVPGSISARMRSWSPQALAALLHASFHSSPNDPDRPISVRPAAAASRNAPCERQRARVRACVISVWTAAAACLHAPKDACLLMGTRGGVYSV